MRSGIVSAAVALALVPAACSTYRVTAGRDEVMQLRVENTIAQFRQRDPGIAKFFDNCHGYAVFPSIGKGAIGIGGAHGEGEVFEKGEFIGWAEMSQGTIGFQLGGQVYSEIIFFENEAALIIFKENDLHFSGNASAVAARAGASATADYDGGVAVFTLPKGGLMFEASIGGQQFDFTPKADEDQSAPPASDPRSRGAWPART